MKVLHHENNIQWMQAHCVTLLNASKMEGHLEVPIQQARESFTSKILKIIGNSQTRLLHRISILKNLESYHLDFLEKLKATPHVGSVKQRLLSLEVRMAIWEWTDFGNSRFLIGKVQGRVRIGVWIWKANVQKTKSTKNWTIPIPLSSSFAFPAYLTF